MAYKPVIVLVDNRVDLPHLSESPRNEFRCSGFKGTDMVIQPLK